MSPIMISISVAKPYGRFGQKLESLQGRSGPGTGQGKTVLKLFQSGVLVTLKRIVRVLFCSASFWNKISDE